MNLCDFVPHIRICFPSELYQIMKLQDRICATMPQPDLFVATSLEENASYISDPNAIFGAFDQEKLIAYASLAFPSNAPDNLGWDLGWKAQIVEHCAKLDTIVVDPDYRGHGLQRTLIQCCLTYARVPDPYCMVLTTVSPENTYSLHNFQSEGFQILKRMEKYGGKDRYILGHSAAGQFPAIS